MYEIDEVIKKDQLENYLVHKGYYEKYNTISISDFSDHIEKSIKPNKDLLDAFYNYIITKYQVVIDRNIHSFFYDFEELVYGLDDKDSKRIALQKFNEIYRVINIKGLNFSNNYKSENGINITQSKGRMFMLFGIREAMKSSIGLQENIVSFLIGFDEYFTSPEFTDEEVFKDLIRFESNLKILVQLNEQYKFEPDYYFTNFKKYSDLFRKYKHIFKSVKIVQFVYELIEVNSSNLSSYNDSLYQVLKEYDLVKGTKENYIKFLKTEFDSKKKDIKIYAPDSNLEHDKRVKKIREKLSHLTS